MSATEKCKKRRVEEQSASAIDVPVAAGIIRSDVLRLSVSGTKIDVTRRTLTIVGGSMLAAKFSGNWDDNLERDTEGNIYIDQSPHLFLKLIEYLRHRANEGSDSPPVESPRFEEDKDNQDFYRMVCYYGMKDDIFSVALSRKATTLVPMHCHPNVQFRCEPNSSVYLVPTDDRFYIRSVEIAFPLHNQKMCCFGWADRGHPGGFPRGRLQELAVFVTATKLDDGGGFAFEIEKKQKVAGPAHALGCHHCSLPRRGLCRPENYAGAGSSDCRAFLQHPGDALSLDYQREREARLERAATWASGG